MATSPAQQRFRDYVKEVNGFTKLTEKAIKSGEGYTRYDLQRFYGEGLLVALDNARQEGDNEEVWKGRYVEYTDAKIDYLAIKYSLSDFEPPPVPPAPAPPEPERQILGYPIITSSECLQKGSRVRGQVLLTQTELADYIAPIPASVINGIVIVYDGNGNVQGYSLCTQKTS